MHKTKEGFDGRRYTIGCRAINDMMIRTRTRKRLCKMSKEMHIRSRLI